MLGQFPLEDRLRAGIRTNPGAFSMSMRMSVLVVFLITLLSATALAHHNMSGIFDFNDRVTLSGTLTKLDWRNPHIEIGVDAKRDNSQIEAWKAEGPTPLFFRTRDTC